MEGGEEEFNEPIEPPKDAKEDPERWKTPLFFNRVIRVHDWNKYNRVHYDAENPPPKISLGYKFCIFYPDAQDPTEAPKYGLPDSDARCNLILNAGTLWKRTLSPPSLFIGLGSFDSLGQSPTGTCTFASPTRSGSSLTSGVSDSITSAESFSSTLCTNDIDSGAFDVKLARVN